VVFQMVVMRFSSLDVSVDILSSWVLVNRFIVK
jgi:hypothetical protein